MSLGNSDKIKVILETGKMEHEEEKITYQFVIGGIVSVSVAILIAIVQNTLKLADAIFFLVGFYEFAVVAYVFIRKRMEKIRFGINEEIKKIGG